MNERRESVDISSLKLGSHLENIDGDQVSSTFTGQGWIVNRYDDGGLLSSKSLDEYLKNPDNEKSISIIDLFPEEWQGSQVEYEITVRAKKLSNS